MFCDSIYNFSGTFDVSTFRLMGIFCMLQDWFFVCLFVLCRTQDIEKQVAKDDGVDLGKKRTTRKTNLQNLNPDGKYLQMWNMMFVVPCTIAVSVDPLFFYLPVINEDNKCLALDNKLKITAICLRSVTDIILQFLCPVKLARNVIVKDAWSIAKRYLLSYFLMDILAILPIPHVRKTILLLNCFCVCFSSLTTMRINSIISY